MLFDSFGRPIRKPRYFGFGRTPANESPHTGRTRAANSGFCCDAIGFALPAPDEDEDEEEEDPIL